VEIDEQVEVLHQASSVSLRDWTGFATASSVLWVLPTRVSVGLYANSNEACKPLFEWYGSNVSEAEDFVFGSSNGFFATVSGDSGPYVLGCVLGHSPSSTFVLQASATDAVERDAVFARMKSFRPGG
jgi:hypothetical protein